MKRKFSKEKTVALMMTVLIVSLSTNSLLVYAVKPDGVFQGQSQADGLAKDELEVISGEIGRDGVNDWKKFNKYKKNDVNLRKAVYGKDGNDKLNVSA